MMSEENARFSWPQHWFGFFCLEDEDDTYFPLLSDFTDPLWDLAERDRCLNYLNSAPGATASFGMTTCQLCGTPIPAAVYREV